MRALNLMACLLANLVYTDLDNNFNTDVICFANGNLSLFQSKVIIPVNLVKQIKYCSVRKAYIVQSLHK